MGILRERPFIKIAAFREEVTAWLWIIAAFRIF